MNVVLAAAARVVLDAHGDDHADGCRRGACSCGLSLLAVASDDVPGFDTRRDEAVALLSLHAGMRLYGRRLDGLARSEFDLEQAERDQIRVRAAAARHAERLISRTIGAIPLDAVRPS